MDRVRRNLKNLCVESLKTLVILKKMKLITDKEYEEHSKAKLLFLKKTK